MAAAGARAETIWRDEPARERLEQWFERFRARIPLPVQSRVVETALGPSHVLVGGPETGPPLICLHAMRTTSAHLLSELGPLLERFRVYAPDLPGQSVRGPQVRAPLDDDTLADWLAQVMDRLDLVRAGLLGVSFGGFVAWRSARAYPERFAYLALIVPAGIVNGSHWRGLTRMALPMLRYRLRPTEENLRRMLDPLLTTWDAEWAAYMGESLSDLKPDLRIPPLARDDELRALTMPTLVLGADQDISFPGEPMVSRVRALIPAVDAELLANCKHCPPTTPEFRTWLGRRVAEFGITH